LEYNVGSEDAVANARPTCPSHRPQPTARRRLCSLAFSFGNGDKRFAGPHDDRLREVHPAALAYGSGRQQAQTLAAAGVDLEDLDPPPGLDAFQMKAGNEPVVGESEGEARVFVERKHPTPLAPTPARRRRHQSRRVRRSGDSRPGNPRRTPGSSPPTGRWARRSPHRTSRRRSWPRPSFPFSSSRSITLLVEAHLHDWLAAYDTNSIWLGSLTSM